MQQAAARRQSTSGASQHSEATDSGRGLARKADRPGWCGRHFDHRNIGMGHRAVIPPGKATGAGQNGRCPEASPADATNHPDPHAPLAAAAPTPGAESHRDGHDDDFWVVRFEAGVLMDAAHRLHKPEQRESGPPGCSTPTINRQATRPGLRANRRPKGAWLEKGRPGAGHGHWLRPIRHRDSLPRAVEKRRQRSRPGRHAQGAGQG